jgi:hypothetical protein
MKQQPEEWISTDSWTVVKDVAEWPCMREEEKNCYKDVCVRAP